MRNVDWLALLAAFAALLLTAYNLGHARGMSFADDWQRLYESAEMSADHYRHEWQDCEARVKP